jgi:adenylate cyclase
MPGLIIKKLNDKETYFILNKDIITLGKNEPEEGIQNDIGFEDKTVSRHHARILKEGTHYFIEDLGSKNRTFVNGKEIKKAELKHGDLITIGLNTLIFESENTAVVNPANLEVKFQELDKSKTVDLNYIILYQISEKLITVADLDEFLKSVMEMIHLAIKAEKSLLLLLGDDGELHYRAGKGPDTLYSKTLVEKVRREKRSLMTSLKVDITTSMISRSVQSVMAAPLLKYNEVIGVIYMEDPRPGKFSPSDLTLLTAIANHVSSGIERVNLNVRIKKEALIRSNLERFLSPHVADKITQDSLETGKINLKAEKVLATILFADIKGFTLLTERLDPSEIADLLNEYYGFVTDIIFKYEGTLDKYMGDGVMAIFGAPIPYLHHARNAVTAALEIQKEQKKFKEKLDPRKKFDIRIGINTGEVVAGYVGSPKRMEYTVLGENVVLAYRLESMADAGGVFIGKQTYKMIEQDFDVQFVGKIKMPKGEKDMEAYKVLGEKSKVSWKVGYKSDVGRVRTSNEDSFYVDEEGGLFIIADGMGGHQGGEVASKIAVEVISGFLKDKISREAPSEVNFELIMKALFKANDEVRMKGESDLSLRGMGTTVVLAFCRDNDLHIAHIGDSRAYLIHEGKIQQLTEDHSVITQMVKTGNLTKEEAKNHKLKHMLSQALGTSTYLAPDIQMFNWVAGDYVLLCSDGLTDMLNDQELLSTILECSIGEPQEGCEMLVDLANKKGGRDNITVILLYKNI